ncbi:hypothetical protein DL991_40945 [Amycolatopsis sp. WAC 01375]|uniref:hypothetical protein n=1 Tax=Amycolatopsis sp. WAC 01375 TaxID=2203194 RepID=UPI000F7B558F|nr:hypothetical protein [Amycolatopsis sp. WAC 01375]RSM68945.1 hypothetical protein DL991_40945 [Amycolatopsis sp. WAC 01375]
MSHSDSPHDAKLEYTRDIEMDKHRYVVTVRPDPDDDEVRVIDLIGAAPDAEVIVEGRLIVHKNALPHLGALLSEAFPDHRLPKARKSRRRGYGKPTQSHRPWTDELKASLHGAWTAADPGAPAQQIVEGIAAALNVSADTVKEKFQAPEATRDPAKVVSVIATIMQRSEGAILNQLPRQSLDPERPGFRKEDGTT